MKILFLSPHPDDSEIACGATIAKFVKEGHTVHIAVAVGEGDLHMVHSDQVIPFHQRKEEQANAARIMGVHEVIYLGLGTAATLDQTPMLKGCCALDKLLTEGAYDRMIFPLKSYNQDHEYVWRIALASSRPSKHEALELYAYEQAMQYHGEQVHGVISTRCYSVVTEVQMDIKIQAMKCHKSQMCEREHSIVGTDGVVTLANLRGLEVGEEYAELLVPVRVFI